MITPAGNWSSYPAHKHDEEGPDESALEEIYWFETAPADGAPADADAFAVFATTGSAAGDIETTALVRTGDVALVPFGYHGPAAAPPGTDLYYLNVMAGPGSGPGASPTIRLRHGSATPGRARTPTRACPTAELGSCPTPRRLQDIERSAGRPAASCPAHRSRSCGRHAPSAVRIADITPGQSSMTSR